MTISNGHKTIIFSAAAVSFCIGIIVIGGWLFQIEPLKRIVNNWPAMKFNTALSLVLCSIVVWLALFRNKKLNILRFILSAAIFLIAFISFLEDIFNFSTSLDLLFIGDEENLSAGFNHPGRMATTTAISFMLMAVAACLFDTRKKNLKVFAQYALHLVSLISFVALTGYIFAIPAFYSLAFLTSMAMHTAMVFLILSLGASFFFADTGITGLFTGNGMGSIIARKTFPMITLLIIVLSFLRIQSHRLQWVSVEFGVALFGISFLLVTLIIISNGAIWLNKIDAERKTAEQSLQNFNTNLEQLVAKRSHDLIQTLEELKKSEGKFRGLLEAAPDAMVIINQEGKIQLINEQTEIFLNYTPEELINNPVEILIPDRHKHKHHMLRNHFISNPKTREMGEGRELFARKKNGDEIPVEISLSPLQTAEGLLIIASLRDITFRKKAEAAVKASEQKLRKVLDAIGDNVWEHDLKKGTTIFSAPVHHILGYDSTFFENATTNFYESLHPDDRHLLEENGKKYNDGSIDKHSLEYRAYHKDGSLKWILDRGVVTERNENDKAVYLVGTQTDITHQKTLEASLLKEKTKYSSIFNAVYQFIGLMSPEGILLDVNETALKFGNVSLEDVIGLPLWKTYWCTISAPAFKSAFERALQGELVKENIEILRGGGEKAWIEFTLKAIYDADGSVILLMPEGRDITEQLSLENRNKEQEEKIRLFVKHTPAAVAMFDTKMNYIIASDRWYNDAGVQGKEIIGKNHYDIFPEIKNNPKWTDIHQRCLQGATEIEKELEYVSADGKTDWLHSEIHPWRKHDGSIGGIIIFTDVITEKIIARENLKRLNQRLLASNAELEQFAYVASHDLQEPLRMVRSFMQLLEEKYEPQLDETAKQYIHFASDGANRMKILINDLLDYSRIGTTNQELTWVDTRAVLEEMKLNFESGEGENMIIINNPDRFPQISANLLQIKQIFQNLIANGIKYRGEESPVIKIGFTEDAFYWQFYVQDNGIGIQPVYFTKVFHLFQRLHTRAKYSGTGIGLAICKKIAEKHGGSIWLESEEGKGSTFYFSIAKNVTAE